MPSCLLALGELEDAHLLTIEGLTEGAFRAGKLSSGTGPGATPLTPVMKAILEENGSQCGFCSPGIVISLTSFLLEGPPYSIESAVVAVEGNLCRCTGYGAIRRAAARLVRDFADAPADFAERVAYLEKAGVIPASVGCFVRGEGLPEGQTTAATASTVPGAGGDRAGTADMARASGDSARLVLGGGTDFYVRNPDPDRVEALSLLSRDPSLRGITRAGSGIEVGAAVTWRDFFASPLVRSAARGIEGFESSLASILVRNRATLGGNVANASPVGDLTSMLIALGAEAKLRGSGGERLLPVERLFLGYKKLDLGADEIIASFLIPAPAGRLFNFEKIAKRANLDIASVNSAVSMQIEGDPGTPGSRMANVRISAGGVGPVPLLLEGASRILEGREPGSKAVIAAMRAAMDEITPIDDARGSAGYRRRIMGRLVLAHFIALFPALEGELAGELAGERSGWLAGEVLP
jgi:xanthine dehydrogenase small subunit